MLSTQQKDLWKRIADFSIDDPSAVVKYSDKLAHSNGWSDEYTARVIEEYKKFVFLCCILPKGASPSQPIDEAWHLHLTYTQNYWKEFCANVLEKEIHHFPSKGGPGENEKHEKWYSETLDAYKETFGHEAPADIWIRQDLSAVQARPVIATHWSYFESYKKYLFVFLIPFVLILVFYNKIVPFNLDGPQFLVFFALLALSGLVYLLLARAKKREEIRTLISEHYKGDADVYQLARFIYSSEWSMRAAIVDLVGRKILQPLRKSQFAFLPSHYKYASHDNNPLLMQLLRNFKDGDTVHYQNLSTCYDEAATYHDGLFNLFRVSRIKDYWPLVIGLLLELIGIARICQGIYNHKPVAYLVMLCFLVALMTYMMYSMMSSTQIVRREFVSSFRNSTMPGFGDAALAGAFVFLGLSSVSAMYGYSHLQRTFSRNPIDTGATAWANCGGSSCGGSGSGCSGGGGCGGGGCGGCGGGN